MNNLVVLGIESSCDETAAGIYSTEKKLIAHTLFSQTKLHKHYGGVIPEIASRMQLEKINVVIDETLQKANMSLDEINTIAVTNTPGLPGSLLVGVCFAKGLAYAQRKSLIAVNHLEAHAFSAMIENQVPFPYICMTASGGHTSLYQITDFGAFEMLGTTHDDAAGEAFDKVAKMIGLGYPGGPIIEKLAAEVNFEDFFHYPRLKNKDLSFSFSGVKTAVLYDLVKRGYYDLPNKKFLAPDNKELISHVASSLLVCIGDIMADRLGRALKEHPQSKAVTFVGGVACNKYLRGRLRDVAHAHDIELFCPSNILCTDNGAMIAFVGHYRAQQGKYADMSLDLVY